MPHSMGRRLALLTNIRLARKNLLAGTNIILAPKNFPKTKSQVIGKRLIFASKAGAPLSVLTLRVGSWPCLQILANPAKNFLGTDAVSSLGSLAKYL